MGELGGHEVQRLEVELYSEIGTGNVLKIVEQPPAGPALEDETLDKTRAEQNEREE